MTTLDKLLAAVAAELGRHESFINDPASGLRSIMVVVKVTTTGDPRAVIFSPETERSFTPVPRTMGQRVG